MNDSDSAKSIEMVNRAAVCCDCVTEHLWRHYTTNARLIYMCLRVPNLFWISTYKWRNGRQQCLHEVDQKHRAQYKEPVKPVSHFLFISLILPQKYKPTSAAFNWFLSLNVTICLHYLKICNDRYQISEKVMFIRHQSFFSFLSGVFL